MSHITGINIAALTYYYFGLNPTGEPMDGIVPLPTIDYSKEDALEIAKERIQQYTIHKAYLQSALFGLIEQDAIDKIQDMIIDCEKPSDLSGLIKALQALKTDSYKIAHIQEFDDLPAVLVRDLSGENRNTDEAAG
jgi:hypothetical protein